MSAKPRIFKADDGWAQLDWSSRAAEQYQASSDTAQLDPEMTGALEAILADLSVPVATR